MRIAFISRKRTGKDTAANFLAGYGFQRLAFGDEMKNRFYDAFPMAVREPKPREHYITFGKLGRAIDEDIWVKFLNDRFLAYQAAGHKDFVITDVRQPNEVQWCIENDFILVDIEVSDGVVAQRMEALGETDPVIDEMEDLIERDELAEIIIHNNGDLGEFYEGLDLLIQHLYDEEAKESVGDAIGLPSLDE